MEDQTYYNLIDDIEISNYFENYSEDEQNLARVEEGDSPATKKRKRFQNALKIGGMIGAATALIAFGPAIISMLTPVMPAIKAGVKARGGDPTKMKIGKLIKTFHEQVVGKKLEGTDEKKNGIQVAKDILGYFKKVKEKKNDGTATPIETKMLELAENATDKIANATDDEVKKVMKKLVADGTEEQELAGTPETPEKGTTTKTETKFDTKTILLVLVGIFLVSKFA